MTHQPRDLFDPIEKKDFDDLIKTISGSLNRSKIQAVKKALWLSLFLTDEEAEWLHSEMKSRGYKDPK